MTTTKTKKNLTQATSFILELIDLKGKPKEKVALNKEIFNGKVSLALLQQAASTYLSNKRAGLAKTKTRGEKGGGGRKPWRQKGTGRARVGSIRSPIWKGGGITFGPRPRSYCKKFPARMRASALRSALCLKLKAGKVILIDKLELESPKAKDFAKDFDFLGVGRQKLCFVLVELGQNIKNASSNFTKVNLRKAAELNALDVLDCQKLVLTKDSLGII